MPGSVPAMNASTMGRGVPGPAGSPVRGSTEAKTMLVGGSNCGCVSRSPTQASMKSIQMGRATRAPCSL